MNTSTQTLPAGYAQSGEINMQDFRSIAEIAKNHRHIWCEMLMSYHIRYIKIAQAKVLT